MKRKALFAGSAVALAGGLVGAITLAGGGGQTKTTPGAAGPAGAVHAQRVADAVGPSSPTAPIPNSSPAGPVTTTPTASPGQKLINLTIRNDLTNPAGFKASVCIDNTARDNSGGPGSAQETHGVCTDPIAPDGKFSLDLTEIKPDSDAAHVVLNSNTPLTDGTQPSIDVPVTAGTITTSCIGLVNKPDASSPPSFEREYCPLSPGVNP